MNKLFSLLAAVTAVALPYAVQANDGVYVGGMAGANFFDLQDFQVKDGSRKVKTHLHTNTGYTLGGVAGYKFCNGLRLEGELSYRHNGLDKLSGHYVLTKAQKEAKAKKEKAESLHANGHINTTSIMGNVYYDLDIDCAIKPYVGVGVGYDYSKLHVNGVKLKDKDLKKRSIEAGLAKKDGYLLNNGKKIKGHKKEQGIAWQAMAGLNYELCDGVDLNLEYKYHKGVKKSYDNALTLGAKKYF